MAPTASWGTGSSIRRAHTGRLLPSRWGRDRRGNSVLSGVASVTVVTTATARCSPRVAWIAGRATSPVPVPVPEGADEGRCLGRLECHGRQHRRLLRLLDSSGGGLLGLRGERRAGGRAVLLSGSDGSPRRPGARRQGNSVLSDVSSSSMTKTATACSWPGRSRLLGERNVRHPRQRAVLEFGHPGPGRGDVERGACSAGCQPHGRWQRVLCRAEGDFGEVACWGEGEEGGLGNGQYYSGTDGSAVAGPGPRGRWRRNADSVASWSERRRRLLRPAPSTGVDCWGAGTHGDLGNGRYYPMNPGGSAVPVQCSSSGAPRAPAGGPRQPRSRPPRCPTQFPVDGR